MKKFFTVFIVSAMAFSAPVRAENSGVVVSIKPLHSLVAAVMDGDGNPAPLLLVDGKQSLHSYTLKPSQRQAIEHAKVVFYIGDHFETFMPPVLASLPEGAQRAPMDNLPSMKLLPMRQGGGHDDHDEGEHGEEGHHHEGIFDLHLWLMPENAKVMAAEIARRLAMAFPEKKSVYFTNLRNLSMKLDLANTHYEEELVHVRDRPFITFHDSLQYVEKRYNLKGAGAITLHPERGVSAKHLQEIRDTIKNAGSVCVFREPQFDGKVVDNLVAGTGAQTGVIDPEGALLSPGPDLYFQLMDGLVTALKGCLQS